VTGLDLRPAFAAAMEAFGVPATVTRPAPDNTPVETTGVWVSSLEEARPVGTDFQRRDPRRVMALPRDVLSTLPRGTMVVAAEELGGVVKTWKVDGLDRVVEADCWRGILVATADA